MKLFVYNYRDFDEAEFFTKFSKIYNVSLGICRQPPSLDNVHLAEGYSYVSIITSKIDADLMAAFSKIGVKVISTRTIGYDHIDLEAAKALGVGVSNATYSPYCVADYTIMLMLMTIRKMKRIMQRGMINDFSLDGNQGQELHNFTVGVIGTGKIGETVIKQLSGFGCKILAYDLYQKDSVKAYAEYTDLDTLLRSSNMITLHTPLTDDNYHLINQEAIDKMPQGTMIINTARGGLIDTKALIANLENGKLGGAGLDVIEDEFGLYYFDRKSDVFLKNDLYILRSLPNVVITHHMAFYSDQATSDMVEHSIASCCLRDAGKEDPWKVL